MPSKRRRALGRSPRVPFSPHQVQTLECKFLHSRYLSSTDVCQLSASLNLSEARVRYYGYFTAYERLDLVEQCILYHLQVKIWFQNRRARAKREDTPSLLSTSITQS